MKVVILAGGFGTRISEESKNIPKPMITINNIPIIVRIMEIYSKFNFNEFIICTGYKSDVIKDYFINLDKYQNDIKINFSEDEIILFDKNKFYKNWKIIISDTGLNTGTAGRIRSVKKYLENDDNFMLTYGDGLSNVNINKLIKFHKSNSKIATLTAVPVPSRFGNLKIEKNLIKDFNEKQSQSYINGGYFVFSKKIFSFLDNSKQVLESDVLPLLSKKKQLSAFKHNGFWQCMDTLRDKIYIEKVSKNGSPPWLK
ncbi:sugar phosphate nucleotidyltransferase [Alphaproteobacteria bacterium]|nr:sugar phosphate nucleotidyltransferase [Alphaproteobacteria bacterium]